MEEQFIQDGPLRQDGPLHQQVDRDIQYNPQLYTKYNILNIMYDINYTVRYYFRIIIYSIVLLNIILGIIRLSACHVNTKCNITFLICHFTLFLTSIFLMIISCILPNYYLDQFNRLTRD